MSSVLTEKRPTVSVCIPVYKPRREHLCAALASARTQTVSDCEVVVRDDASLASLDELRSLLPDGSGLRVLRGDRRLGIGGNWNATWRASNGKYIALLFQDDTWKPTYLERCIDVLERHATIGFVACAHGYAVEESTSAAATGIYADVQHERASLSEGILGPSFLIAWLRRGLRPNIVGEPSFVVIRRTCLEQIGGFDERMKQGLDTDAWARLLLITQGYWIAEELGTFRVHAQGASAGNEKHGRGMFDRLLTIRRISSMATDSTIRSAARSALLRQTATAGSRLLVRKTNHPVIQFMRYLLVGGSASIVDFCVYALLARLVGLNIFAAAFVGYTVGFGWNHLLSVLWIFQSKHSRKKEVTLAYAIAIGGLLWTELFLWAFVHGIGMNDLIARFLTMWIVLIWNYTMRKKFVFG